MSATVQAPQHPKYIDMVVTAITTLKERNGSSRQAIVKYVKGTYPVGEQADRLIKVALKKLVAAEDLTQVKGTGASGSFKMNKAKLLEKAKAAKKPAVKKDTKPAAKKPATNKSPAKKVARKPAAKKTVPKSPKKTAAKSPKKAAPKSPTKKAE